VTFGTSPLRDCASLTTSRGFLSSWSPTNFEWRSRSTSVHSRNAICATESGRRFRKTERGCMRDPSFRLTRDHAHVESLGWNPKQGRFLPPLHCRPTRRIDPQWQRTAAKAPSRCFQNVVRRGAGGRSQRERRQNKDRVGSNPNGPPLRHGKLHQCDLESTRMKNALSRFFTCFSKQASKLETAQLFSERLATFDGEPQNRNSRASRAGPLWRNIRLPCKPGSSEWTWKRQSKI
jgi:hypothetical protein